MQYETKQSPANVQTTCILPSVYIATASSQCVIWLTNTSVSSIYTTIIDRANQSIMPSCSPFTKDTKFNTETNSNIRPIKRYQCAWPFNSRTNLPYHHIEKMNEILTRTISSKQKQNNLHLRLPLPRLSLTDPDRCIKETICFKYVRSRQMTHPL
jgi:hypothetical protein